MDSLLLMQTFEASFLAQQGAAQRLEALTQQVQLMQLEVAQLEPIKCDVCGGKHDNGCCEIDLFVQETCDMGWSDHSNFPWQQDFQLYNEPPPQQIDDRRATLEETLIEFICATQLNFENVNKSIINLTVQVGILAHQVKETWIVDTSNGKMLTPVVENFINEELSAEQEVDIVHKSNEESLGIVTGSKEKKRTENNPMLKNKEEQLASVLEILKKLHSNDSSDASSWEELHFYAKFMEFLPRRRKNKDIFFVSYWPP